jgi:hypothetical protein
MSSATSSTTQAGSYGERGCTGEKTMSGNDPHSVAIFDPSDAENTSFGRSGVGGHGFHTQDRCNELIGSGRGLRAMLRQAEMVAPDGLCRSDSRRNGYWKRTGRSSDSQP